MSFSADEPFVRQWRIEHGREGDAAIERAESNIVAGRLEEAAVWVSIAREHYRAAALERPS